MKIFFSDLTGRKLSLKSTANTEAIEKRAYLRGGQVLFDFPLSSAMTIKLCVGALYQFCHPNRKGSCVDRDLVLDRLFSRSLWMQGTKAQLEKKGLSPLPLFVIKPTHTPHTHLKKRNSSKEYKFEICMNPFLVLKTIVFVWLFTHDIGIDDLLSYLCLSFFVSLSLLLFSIISQKKFGQNNKK